LIVLRKKLFKKLFLLLVLALSVVPVFQAAHMLTHVVPVDMIEAVQADGAFHEDEGDADANVDKICLDCLALTSFSAVLAILVICLFSQQGHCRVPPRKPSRPLLDFPFAYLTRAPPQA
jgi:hypothetical protein